MVKNGGMVLWIVCIIKYALRLLDTRHILEGAKLKRSTKAKAQSASSFGGDVQHIAHSGAFASISRLGFMVNVSYALSVHTPKGILCSSTMCLRRWFKHGAHKLCAWKTKRAPKLCAQCAAILCVEYFTWTCSLCRTKLNGNYESKQIITIKIYIAALLHNSVFLKGACLCKARQLNEPIKCEIK